MLRLARALLLSLPSLWMLLLPHPAPGQKTARQAAAAAAPEASTARAFEEARSRGPLALYAFLYPMPKGGDLHNHLSGAVYAESWLRAAAEDHLCIDVATLSFLYRPNDPGYDPHPTRCEPSPTSDKDSANPRYPAAAIADNPRLYQQLVDAFSMRSFVPTPGNSGHDHFFATFEKFTGTSNSHLPEWLDEVATRAADQNEQYLELMHTPTFAAAAELALKAGFDPDFVHYRQTLLDAGLRDQVPAIRAELDGYLTQRRQLEHCDTPAAAPACQVDIRFLYQVLRNLPPPLVFAQILQGFEVAASDPGHILALNLVQPEDGFYAMRDYRLHLRMLAELHRFYPQVHLTLHAGELAPGLVPPEGLRFHIHDAITTAGAERIGHGVDILYEDHPADLLRTMAAHHILAEINLTSNDGILNVFGDEHPLPDYIAAGVPVALSTDDEGVNRSNMTHEYTRAAATYLLSYHALKNMARNSITFSFLPGQSLWPLGNPATTYKQPATACASSLTTLIKTPACAVFLKTSEKASAQWDLERRFHAFESAPHE